MTKTAMIAGCEDRVKIWGWGSQRSEERKANRILNSGVFLTVSDLLALVRTERTYPAWQFSRPRIFEQ
jgi:hypothetical protein